MKNGRYAGMKLWKYRGSQLMGAVSGTAYRVIPAKDGQPERREPIEVTLDETPTPLRSRLEVKRDQGDR